MSETIQFDAAGPIPQTPQALNALLIALVQAAVPGYTARLPGSLIEDISSTDTYALLQCDSAMIELLNSISPLLANPFLLRMLGQIYGVQQGVGTTTSVEVVFSGTVGFVIEVGFVVSDGTYQYTVQDTGIVGADGSSASLGCLATVLGTWAVPAGTVTQIVTSVPSGVTLSVTNPATGVPGSGAQTVEDYRSQVLQAGQAIVQGVPASLRTALENVSGVQPNLVSIRQKSPGWEIIVGGGDPYEVAGAIFSGVLDISTLVGSTIDVTNITATNPGTITTDLNHGYVSGQTIELNGVVSTGTINVNGTPEVATVLTEKTFTIPVNLSAGFGYTSGGVVTPNLRNETVTINNYPDSYGITFVRPPQQTVTVAVTWNTTSTNVVSPAAVAQLAAPALASYINELNVGQPINLFELQTVFQQAIASILTPQLLTRMIFAVDINGVSVSPESGTGIIAGDPESYFFTTTASIVISQG